MNRTLVSIAKKALNHNRTSPSPNSRLFVAGLSWSVDEKSLKDAFSSFGEVTEVVPIGICAQQQAFKPPITLVDFGVLVRIMYDKDSGRSRGFGFVSFSKENEAICAKDAMDGKALLGRPLRINFALEKVRGGPVVVPRLPNAGDASNRNA